MHGFDDFPDGIDKIRAAAETMSASQGSESKADAVVARLGEILQEVDMAITTERQITNKLAEELGEDVYEYKALIRVSYCSEQQVVLMILNDEVTVGQIYRIMLQSSLPAILPRRVLLRPQKASTVCQLLLVTICQTTKLRLVTKGSVTQRTTEMQDPRLLSHRKKMVNLQLNCQTHDRSELANSRAQAM